uniref:Uncharacterized protein n=1 Tax=Aegilops tauschii subsp. strangulata TaxID=200361 RepID=A0A453HNB5_AEGTS
PSLLFDSRKRRTTRLVEPDSVFLKKEGKQNRVKMIWFTPSSCAKDLTISEGTGATFLFNFHSRVSIYFHALF